MRRFRAWNNGVPLIHISCKLVFNGESRNPHMTDTFYRGLLLLADAGDAAGTVLTLFLPLGLPSSASHLLYINVETNPV